MKNQSGGKPIRLRTPIHDQEVKKLKVGIK
jgi:hypothetical protein